VWRCECVCACVCMCHTRRSRASARVCARVCACVHVSVRVHVWCPNDPDESRVNAKQGLQTSVIINSSLMDA
jgi:hypothetical protein